MEVGRPCEEPEAASDEAAEAALAEDMVVATALQEVVDTGVASVAAEAEATRLIRFGFGRRNMSATVVRDIQRDAIRLRFDCWWAEAAGAL